MFLYGYVWHLCLTGFHVFSSFMNYNTSSYNYSPSGYLFLNLPVFCLPYPLSHSFDRKHWQHRYCPLRNRQWEPGSRYICLFFNKGKMFIPHRCLISAVFTTPNWVQWYSQTYSLEKQICLSEQWDIWLIMNILILKKKGRNYFWIACSLLFPTEQVNFRCVFFVFTDWI